MGDISPVLLAACGFAVICAGLIFVTVLMVLRFLGGSRGGAILGLFGGATREDNAELELLPQRRSRRLTSSDLDAKAQSLDFDAALQKYRQTPASPMPGAQSAPPASPLPSLRGTAAPAPPSRVSQNTSLDREDPLDEIDGRSFNLRNTNNQSLRRSRREREDDRDEFIGGFLDGE